MSPAKCCVLILVTVVVATASRLPRLEQRPMHGDEAVQAFKLGELLADNHYKYDRDEYHGPTLNYLSLVPAWLHGIGNFVDLQESVLRIVPVFFGILLIVLLLAVGDGLGRMSSVFAALFTAVSPAMVFYSRYYIHEMLLVCFSFGVIACGYRYLKSQSVIWALLTGMFLGLMHATKETCVIAYGSMAVGILVLLYTRKRSGDLVKDELKRLIPGHCVLMTAAALTVSTLLFTSFFNNTDGMLDSILTFGTYLERAGQNTLHEQPWYFYLGLLSYYQYADGPIYSEVIIIVLALVGLVATFKGVAGPGNEDLPRFLGIYTIAMTAIYSLIPYKTPWCLLGFFHGMILMAGVGASYLIRLKPVCLRGAIGGLLTIGVGHLGWQAYSSSYQYFSDSRNPHVYAHTGTDIFQIVDRVKGMASVQEDGRKSAIQVICPKNDYWPLPWYLRGFQAKFLSEVPEETKSAPIILIQPSLETALTTKLYEWPPPGQRELYMHLFYSDGRVEDVELRPEVKILGFVTKTLWDRFQYKEMGSPSDAVQKPGVAEDPEGAKDDAGAVRENP